MARAEAGADPDRALVDQARQGDLDAFSELVRRYQHRLVGYLRLIVNHREDAEDVAQEAFLRAYRALGRFRGQSSFKTWLYQIATNAARTSLAKRPNDPARARRGDRNDRHDEAESKIVADPSDFEAGLLARDRVGHALAELPLEWREAVVLRDIEGLDYREIAELMNIPIGTVESRIFRGRQRLRQILLRSAS